MIAKILIFSNTTFCDFFRFSDEIVYNKTGVAQHNNNSFRPLVLQRNISAIPWIIFDHFTYEQSVAGRCGNDF